MALSDKIRMGLNLYPCDLLFVHRDAEKQDPKDRLKEIDRALANVRSSVPVLRVVPVRMSEAWLLIDERAIRKAARNPNGKMKLMLPKISELERLSDPKKQLYQLLEVASGLSGHRLKEFNPAEKVQLVAESTEDFSLLSSLDAFTQLDNDLQNIIQQQRWNVTE